VLEGGCGRLVYCSQNLDGGGAAWEFCPCSVERYESLIFCVVLIWPGWGYI
jgi:hypothetical protein